MMMDEPDLCAGQGEERCQTDREGQKRERTRGALDDVRQIGVVERDHLVVTLVERVAPDVDLLAGLNHLPPR